MVQLAVEADRLLDDHGRPGVVLPQRENGGRRKSVGDGDALYFFVPLLLLFLSLFFRVSVLLLVFLLLLFS